MSRDGWAALPSRGCLRFVIVVFPDHTHLLFFFSILLKIHRCKFNFRYWNGSRFKSEEVDFKGHQFRSNLSHIIFFIPGSTDVCPGLLWRLHNNHGTIRNVLLVWYALINTHLKMPTYPTHSDYYSLAIKFNILEIFKVFFFRLALFEEATGIFKR